MSDIATCAKCGKKKELCRSGIADGIQQPRVCKECLIEAMGTDELKTVDEYWLKQLVELKDFESLRFLGVKDE